MQRRTFLQSLLGAVVAPLLADGSATTASPGPTGPAPERAASPANITTQAPPSVRRLLLQESPLAGFQYHAGERLWPLLTPGAPLTLRREPDNPHDKRAVAIHFRGQRIGYVPRIENTATSQLLDRGERLGARIIARRQSNDPWQRLRVAVYWEATS